MGEIDCLHNSMARRKPSSNTLLALLSKTHPAVGFVMGAGLYAGVRWGLPALALELASTNDLLSKLLTVDLVASLDQVLSWVGLVVAAACWLAAAAAWLARRKRSRLADIQTGLRSIQALGWQDFERLVAEAYSRQGYRVVENGGGGADGGIDLLIRRGGKTHIVQCKQWRSKSVSVVIAREMWGLVAHHGYAGVKIVSTGDFTPDAQDFARGKAMELVNGEGLLDLLGLPASRKTISGATSLHPSLAPTAPRCPQCKRPMVKRIRRATGAPFLGCSGYPDCRGTRSLP